MTKTHKIIYYILLTLISIQFIAAAIPKLMGDTGAIEGFRVIHLPIWFMYFIGAAEALGAIGLWIPRLSFWAASGLLIILLGAIITTAVFINVATATIPLVSAIILGIVVWMGKKREMPIPESATTPSQTI